MDYVNKRRFLNTQYGVRKDGDIFKIGDSSIGVDTGGDIMIKERIFKESKGLCELLTSKKVNTDFIPKNDLKTYKKILTMTNAHLTKYQPDSNINITRGGTFGILLRPSLRNRRDAGSNPHYVLSGQSINGYHGDLYYDESSPAGFSALTKFRAVEAAERKKKVKPQTVGAIKAW